MRLLLWSAKGKMAKADGINKDKVEFTKKDKEKLLAYYKVIHYLGYVNG